MEAGTGQTRALACHGLGEFGQEKEAGWGSSLCAYIPVCVHSSAFAFSRRTRQDTNSRPGQETGIGAELCDSLTFCQQKVTTTHLMGTPTPNRGRTKRNLIQVPSLQTGNTAPGGQRGGPLHKVSALVPDWSILMQI